MSPEVFRRTRTIVPGDVDELGHVNNVRWLAFVGELAAAHAVMHGSDLAALRAQGALWIVRRHELDYHRPALPGEEIVEETWVEKMTGAKSERHSRFTRASDGAPLGYASGGASWRRRRPRSSPRRAGALRRRRG